MEETQYPFPVIRIHRLVLVSALGQLCRIFPPGRIENTVYPMIRATSKPYTFLKKLLLAQTVLALKPMIVFHHTWYDNYYHWTLEFLPRLLAAKQVCPDTGIMLPDSLKSFHYEQLAILGIGVSQKQSPVSGDKSDSS